MLTNFGNCFVRVDAISIIEHKPNKSQTKTLWKTIIKRKYYVGRCCGVLDQNNICGIQDLGEVVRLAPG